MPRLSGFLVSSSHYALTKSIRSFSTTSSSRFHLHGASDSRLPVASRTISPLLHVGESNFSHCATQLEDIQNINYKSEMILPFVDKNIVNVMNNRIVSGCQDAFYVVDLRAVLKRHELWQSKLPNVRPFYAVKCNPDENILKMLQQLGCGFDCASKEEIEAVLRAGGQPNSIIYANPCKQVSHIQHAKQQNVQTMTFDSCDELSKVKQFHQTSKLILRLLVDDSHSQCQLGSKFGAPLEQVPELLSYARQLGLNVKGVSFHVGSGCFNTTAYSKAVMDARKVFNMAKLYNFDFDTLDIGGGFPGDDLGPISFDDIATVLSKALREHFPDGCGTEIIAEPGRFYVAASHTLAVNVIGRKLVSKPAAQRNYKSGGSSMSNSRHLHASSPHYMYYVNDGVYGSFNCLLYDHANVSPRPMINESSENSPAYACSVWGPTCDGLDCISKEAILPIMNIGQWIYFEHMGAYTSAAGSCFNGFQPPQKLYIE